MATYEYDLKEILPRLQGPLRTVLDRELAAGNVITEISAPWPMKNCNVWLAQRFHRSYSGEFTGIEYSYLGDPKNWIEQYIDKEHGSMVAVSASAGI